MTGPPVDVVVPFAGSDAELRELVERMSVLRLGERDTLTIVDNRPAAPGAPLPGVIRAPAQQSSYYARNRGAERGSADWILFLDSDVEPPPDLVERYFADEPGERTAVLAGAVEDAPLGADATMAERYAVKLAQMSQQNTLDDGPWAYAQTANAMFRRTAFDEVGGFTEGIRSGGDADICFRLRAAAWQLEPRMQARVVHRNRATLRAFLRQKARHGSGAAWLDKRYPGSFPRRRQGWEDLKWLRRELMAARRARRAGDHEAAESHLMPPLVIWAFELGRRLPNRVKGRG